MRGSFVVACLVLAAIVSERAAGAQNVTTADLAGVVLDRSNAVVPDANVTIADPATNLLRTVRSEADGRFSIRALPPGSYTVTVAARDFATQMRDVVLTLGSIVRVEFVLVNAVAGETVVVTATPPLVDPEGTVIAHIVSAPQIQNLPINVRDFISFSLITPGVSSDRTPQQGSSATSGLTFAGQRARANNITVDGLDNNDSSNGGVRAVFSQEAVREFQVLTGSYSAEFGKASGGIVNIVTKSGTNRTAGNVFGFLRDETLNAKEYFERFTPAGDRLDQEKAPYGQQQFGATLGGPLRTDRTFYFLSFERLGIQANNFVNINNQQIVTAFGRSFGTAVDILRSAGFPIETGHVPYRVHSNELFAKVTHVDQSSRRMDVRFQWGTGLNENIEPWGGQVAKSRGASLDNDDYMLAASHTATLSPKVLNEIRTQIAYRDQSVIALDPTCVGPCNDEHEGGPTLEILGVASVGRQRFTPQAREALRYQLVDTLTLERSRHLMKVGVDYNYIDHPSGSLPLHFGGRYIFQPLSAIPGVLPAPISSIQALALGLPAAYVQGYGNSTSAYAVPDLSLFAQDDWALGPDVTLKLGVRYQNQFWPDITYQAQGLGSYSFPSDRNNVAPRVAAAWSPGGSRNLSIRASYGVFYDNQLTGIAGIADVVDGMATGVRTLVRTLPGSLVPWNAPGHRLTESAAGSFPSLAITIDPKLKTPYAHHTSIGMNRQLPGRVTLAADFLYVRGHDQLGTLDYNPVVPALGPGRRPGDTLVGGVAVPGTSASVLQYTSFGQTWYQGLILSLAKNFRAGHQFLASYTVSKAEDNSTDYQSAFIPENTGKGRDPGNPTGLPIDFDAMQERGPSVQDQRHRFVLSGVYTFRGDVQLSSIIMIASGRPYNILAGADLNGDGNGGSSPPDRARSVPSDPTTSVTRNSGTLPMQATVDARLSRRFQLKGRLNIEGAFEVFNLFNRTNFTEINNVFGTGVFPTSPLPTYGQFEKAAAPLQAQLMARVSF